MKLGQGGQSKGGLAITATVVCSPSSMDVGAQQEEVKVEESEEQSGKRRRGPSLKAWEAAQAETEKAPSAVKVKKSGERCRLPSPKAPSPALAQEDAPAQMEAEGPHDQVKLTKRESEGVKSACLQWVQEQADNFSLAPSNASPASSVSLNCQVLVGTEAATRTSQIREGCAQLRAEAAALIAKIGAQSASVTAGWAICTCSRNAEGVLVLSWSNPDDYAPDSKSHEAWLDELPVMHFAVCDKGIFYDKCGTDICATFKAFENYFGPLLMAAFESLEKKSAKVEGNLKLNMGVMDAVPVAAPWDYASTTEGKLLLNIALDNFCTFLANDGLDLFQKIIILSRKVGNEVLNSLELHRKDHRIDDRDHLMVGNQSITITDHLSCALGNPLLLRYPPFACQPFLVLPPSLVLLPLDIRSLL